MTWTWSLHGRRPPGRRKKLAGAVHAALEMGEGFLQVLPPGSVRPELMGTRLACASCGQSFPELEPYTFSFNSPRGWCPYAAGMESSAGGK